ncbi:hypothetical protein [Haloferax sp. DFSO52]|uniref:hypothetical protein n=1 Tax=Haloferax sp. DFSO52 TaxID=3388505 RepID=UPI003A880867
MTKTVEECVVHSHDTGVISCDRRESREARTDDEWVCRVERRSYFGCLYVVRVDPVRMDIRQW